MPASAGAYVHYRLDELLAIACLESWRQGSRLIGEDLGTVEPALKRALRAHDVAGMRVAVFDLDAVPSKPLAPPASTVAYVDTHDTATFAGFLGGEEIDLRQSLGLLDPPAAGAARSRRAATRRAIEARLRQSGALPRGDGARTVSILAALLEELGRSDAELVIVNLEDLWGETDPHNVPGTTLEHANFARRLEPSIEDQARRADHDGADPGRADPGRADPGRADPGRADPGRNTNGQDASARAGSRHESSPTSRAVPTRERGRR
jgi:(1->4)-alpha-D-glucan 1-alpha-D-glucosylmutase